MRRRDFIVAVAAALVSVPMLGRYLQAAAPRSSIAWSNSAPGGGITHFSLWSDGKIVWEKTFDQPVESVTIPPTVLASGKPFRYRWQAMERSS